MKNFSATAFPTTRREFLRHTARGAGLLAFCRFAPSFLVESTLAATPPAEKDRPILVVVQLAGGNDGLNTVIPFEDADYYRLRPTLSVPKSNVLKLNDTLGLHPACSHLHRLFSDGELAIVQNVGYPNPNRSHFRSTEIWETASDAGEVSADGWLGRFMDNACAGAPVSADPCAVHLTNDLPQSFTSEHEHPTFGLSNDVRASGSEESVRLLEQMVAAADEDHGNEGFLKHTMMDALVTERRVERVLQAYRPAAAYPGSAFGRSLKNVAALISAGLSTRVYFVSLSGFDTHSNQLTQHANLLRTLSEGLSVFQGDLKARRLDRQVLTMTFSEFGRRPSENDSHGTDHGTAAPLFVMGTKVRAGLAGTSPSLKVARNEDLTFSTDFRQVYATMLDRWLGCPSTAVLGKNYSPLDVIA